VARSGDQLRVTMQQRRKWGWPLALAGRPLELVGRQWSLLELGAKCKVREREKEGKREVEVAGRATEARVGRLRVLVGRPLKCKPFALKESAESGHGGVVGRLVLLVG